MNFEKELKDSYGRLRRLKANVHTWAIGQIVAELRRKWKPKTKVVECEGVHGSRKGETTTYTLYYDEYTHTWTPLEDNAFRGYVMKYVFEKNQKQ